MTLLIRTDKHLQWQQSEEHLNIYHRFYGKLM